MTAAELENVTKRYGRITALDGVDLSVRRGEVLAVLGPNGAGKTTTVQLLMGLIRPEAGRARLLDHDPRSLAARRRCGAMLQVSGVPATLRVAEHLKLFASYYPAPLTVPEAIRAAGLEGLERRPVLKLSGGQRQRLMFALALIGNPELLFLDEPTVGLDVTARRRFWQEIRRLAGEGRTILLTTHYLEEADALADRIVVLNRGRIVAQGAPNDIKARTANRRIRCHTRIPADTIRHWEQVQRVRVDAAAVEILTAEAEAVVRRLLDADPHLNGLEVVGAGLEEAFLDLTEDDGQEAA